MDENLKKEITELVRELQQQDSIEVGNAKTGVLKVYLNVLDLAVAKKKIENAKALLFEARKGILE